jgi:hypothetical protein
MSMRDSNGESNYNGLCRKTIENDFSPSISITDLELTGVNQNTNHCKVLHQIVVDFFLLK